KAGKMRRRWKGRLRSREKCERLGNVQRSEVHGGTQILENLRRNLLMAAKLWPAVHDTMPYRHRCGVNMRADCLSQGGQRFALRFYNTLALQDDVAVRGANVQSAILVPNTLCAPGQHGLFLALTEFVHAKLQRRRPAVEHKDQIIIRCCILRHAYPGHFQVRTSSLSMPSL